mmetsp:Transcript_11117/g.29705  ORF Transcript_11117/g.29705 Transcript_11117/m.29705 type:complete len:256 (+) Transcript_11117:948-1715(+)
MSYARASSKVAGRSSSSPAPPWGPSSSLGSAPPSSSAAAAAAAFSAAASSADMKMPPSARSIAAPAPPSAAEPPQEASEETTGLTSPAALSASCHTAGRDSGSRSSADGSNDDVDETAPGRRKKGEAALAAPWPDDSRPPTAGRPPSAVRSKAVCGLPPSAACHEARGEEDDAVRAFARASMHSTRSPPCSHSSRSLRPSASSEKVNRTTVRPASGCSAATTSRSALSASRLYRWAPPATTDGQLSEAWVFPSSK